MAAEPYVVITVLFFQDHAKVLIALASLEGAKEHADTLELLRLPMDDLVTLIQSEPLEPLPSEMDIDDLSVKELLVLNASE